MTINSSRVTGLITGSANLDMVVYDTWYLWRSGKYLGNAVIERIKEYLQRG